VIKGKRKIKKRIQSLADEKKPFLFVLNFDGKKAFVEPLDQCADKDVLFKVKHLKNYESPVPSKEPFTFSKYPISKEKYKKGFDIVQQAISDGNT